MRKLKILLLFLSPIVVSAQDLKPDFNTTGSLSYAQVDSLSYQYYLQKDLSSLKLLTEVALAQGIDFFYLRSRLAVIAYEKQNYDLAYKHFLKASEKQPDDEVIQEYIFYSLKFNFRIIEAETYAQGLSQLLQLKILSQKSPSVIPTVSIGVLFSPQTTSVSDNKGRAGIYAEGKLNGNMVYENLNLYFKLKRRSTLSIGLSHYATQSLGFVQTNLVSKTKDITTTQIQADLYYRYFIKKGLFVGVGGAYYGINSAYYTSQYDFLKGYTYKTEDLQLNGYSALVNINKRSAYFNTGFQYSLYELNNQMQHQVSGDVRVYPLGNTKFTMGAGLSETFSQANYTIMHIYSSVLPKKWLQISADFYSGNMQNYISESGQVTYNTLDPIQQMFSLRADLFYKKIVLSPSFVFQKRESSYLQYTSLSNSQILYKTYNTQLLNLSLSWKF